MLHTLLNLLNTLLRHRKFVLIYMLSVGVLTSALMIIVPKTYKTRTTIHSVSGTESTGLLGMLSGLSGGINVDQNETGFLLSILKSRVLLSDLVDEFNFVELFDSELKTEAILGLRENLQFDISDEGAIIISFEHQTNWLASDENELEVQKLAKDVLDYVITYLDNNNVKLKTQSARYQREFLESRYQAQLAIIDSLELVSKDYREAMGIISLEAQIEGKMQIVVELKTQLMNAEAQIFVARKLLSQDAPKLKELLTQRESILEQMKQHELGYSQAHGVSFNKLFLPVDSIPSVSISIMRQMYEIDANSKLLEYLAGQLEEAKLRETKDTPTIQIVDPPYFPEIRSAPQRTITVILTGIVAFFFITIVLHLLANIRTADRSSKLATEIEELKGHLKLSDKSDIN